MADFLRKSGHQVTIAFPATRSHRPELNSYSIFQKPNARTELAFGDHTCVAVGTRFPELEFTYCKPSVLWQKLIDENDCHVVISGTPAMAMPLIKANIPHLIWCASDVSGDRSDRQKAYGFVRRWFDQNIVTPALLRLQNSVLNGTGQFVAISPFTQQNLQNIISVKDKVGVLSIPTDTEIFRPPKNHQPGWELGFAGRLSDTRKNATLLFDVITNLRQRGKDVSLTVTGEVTDELRREVSRRGIDDIVTFTGQLDLDDFVAFYQNLDVLLISSFQEGHAIVGIEAMACGVPVISTRCGGPEAYVNSGENGYLVDFEVSEMVARVRDICSSHRHRVQLSENARNTAVSRYGHARFENELRQYWRDTFNSELSGS
jgi:glycosyltransferase involved in cell wall biosynthesis